MKIQRPSALHTPEFHKKRKTRIKKRALIIGGIIIAVIVIPSVFFHLHRFYISEIEVSGNSVTPSENIESIINRDLSGNYLLIYPKRNFLIFPRAMLENDLMNEVPRLDSAKVKLEGKILKVIVSERKPVALYCKDISNIAMPTGCYFFDGKGYIFSESPSFSGDVYFIYASDPPYDDPLRQKFFEEKEFQAIADFVKDLETIGVHGRAFLYKGDEYNLLLTNGGKLIWNKKDKLSDIKSNLEAFLKDPNIAKDTNFLNKILYLDMRFSNKVFYKFQ